MILKKANKAICPRADWTATKLLISSFKVRVLAWVPFSPNKYFWSLKMYIEQMWTRNLPHLKEAGKEHKTIKLEKSYIAMMLGGGVVCWKIGEHTTVMIGLPKVADDAIEDWKNSPTCICIPLSMSDAAHLLRGLPGILFMHVHKYTVSIELEEN